MGSRYEVELTLKSATNLKNVNWRYGPVMPYVVVWIDPKCKMSTRVDEMGDINPHWDQTIVIPFNSPVEDSTLFIDVVHANAMEGTKPLIGSARVPLHSVVSDVGFGHRIDRMLELRRQSGRPHGKINVRLNVRQPQPHYGGMDPYPPAYGVPQPQPQPQPQHGTRDFHGAPAAYGAPYGAPHHPPSSGYAAPPAGYPQTAAPGGYYDGGQRGYGSQPSYGDSQPNSEKPKKKSSSGGGLGLGAGLAMGAVAGALGAVAISEGIDYAEDKFDDHVQEKVEEELEDSYDLDD